MPVGRERGVLFHDQNAVSNRAVIAQSAFFGSIVINYLCSWADTTVFVNDGAFDGGACPDANGQLIDIRSFDFVGSFVEIGPHHHRIANRDILTDVAAEANHTILNPSARFNDASISNQAAFHTCAVYSSRRQKTRSRVDWREIGRELKWRVRMRELHVGFVKRTDCANVFPVTVKQMDLYQSLVDGCWEHLFAEILVVVFL